MQKKYDRLKNKIIRREKEKNGRREKKGKKKGKLHKLQKPNKEAEVYSNSKKCD